ncbi:hypothetical protein [Shewanella atlantica]|uniref:hypothetical protein n=1 Tax=Shewanella atlantica TaxID=271099 RepID=UPI003736BCA3
MNCSKISSLALVVGIMMTPNIYADNSASSFTKPGTAIFGAVANRAELATPDGYTKVLTTELKNSGTPKDLVIGLSFETTLFTETVVRSKNGNKSSATAAATIEMMVYVDGQMVEPGNVVFDRREQTLFASLGGVLDCVDEVEVDTGVPDGIIGFDECNLTDEEIGLILDTTAAHSFNFLAYDIGSGSHTIDAYAKLTWNDEVVTPEANSSANASLGKGTLTVWEVHGSNSVE